MALTGEVNLSGSSGMFVLSIGFGSKAAEAGQRARASVMDDFDKTQAEYIREW